VESWGHLKMQDVRAVGCGAAFHGAVPPLSPGDESPFPSCNVAGTSRGELGPLLWKDGAGGRARGGKEASRVSSYCMGMDARMQLRAGAQAEKGVTRGNSYVPSFRESYFNGRALAPSLSPTQTHASISQRRSLFLHQRQTLN
jgi:hypothetical protein